MLYGGVHIKEAFVTSMAQAQVRDGVAFIGLREGADHLQLYTCMMHPKKFENVLNGKLNQAKTSTHDAAQQNRPKLREYLKKTVDNIASQFNLTVVTDVVNDHLLTVKQDDAYFVYFGAMTENLIHVACWLRIAKTGGKNDFAKSPKLFFWVLHTSYAQELEALGDLEQHPKNTEDDVKKGTGVVLDLTDGIESS